MIDFKILIQSCSLIAEDEAKDLFMQVPLLDLKTQFSSYEQEVMKEISEIAGAQYFINGPKVDKAEKDLSAYLSTDYTLGVSSGSDALIISLMAEEIGAGDEVICPPFTFFATAGAVHRVGAKPVYCDVEEASFNIPAKIFGSSFSCSYKSQSPFSISV